MPTYDYECKKCNHTFEVFQSMSDDALTECPECKGEIRRLIGGGLGIIFKGDGFYVTDNKAKAPANSSAKDSSKESKDTSSSSSKSDTGSETKSTDNKGKSSSKEPVKS